MSLTCQEGDMFLSAPHKNRRPSTVWRARLMHRVAQRITRALGPLTPQELLLFNPQEGFSTLEWIRDKYGRWVTRKRDPGFFERLYTDLPRDLQRRLFIEGRTPDARERRKLEQEILGHARRKLMRELVARIKKLPHLVGKGRNRIEKAERSLIRKRVKELTKKTSKRQAVATTATERKLSERQIWRIISGH